MLLSGGFENQVMRLIHMFRLKEKQAAISAASDSTSDSVDFRPWTESSNALKQSMKKPDLILKII